MQKMSEAVAMEFREMYENCMQIPAVRQTYTATYGYLLTILFMFFL